MLKKSTGRARNTIDKFYTSPDAISICIEALQRQTIIHPTHDVIIEPSAGDGAFIPACKTLSSNTIFIDIHPEHPDIIKQDYLQFDSSNLHFEKIHVVGNPPFGKQSSTAIKFIKKSCSYCDTISFILPKSFKKNSLKKAFALRFHLVEEIDLPVNSFLVDDSPYDVPCVFQIWIARNYNRVQPPIATPINFIFVKKNNHPDISFRRVGVNAEVIDTSIEQKSEQSHYFIKFTNGFIY